MCISILHPPGDDPHSYESRYPNCRNTERHAHPRAFAPQLGAVEPGPVGGEDSTVRSEHAGRCVLDPLLLPSLSSHLFAEPNDESSANLEAAKLWRSDRAQYNATVQALVKRSLGF